MSTSSSLHVGCIHYGQATASEPLPNYLMQEIEGISRSRLIVLVIGNKGSAEVRRDNLRRQKVLAGKRRLAGTGG